MNIYRFLFIVCLLSSAGAVFAQFPADSDEEEAGKNEMLSPKHPAVIASVNRAVQFLEKEGVKEERLGGRALIAMAILKAGGGEEHPYVADAIKRIQKAIKPDGSIDIKDHIYTAGMVILFLGDFGETYRKEIQAFNKFLHRNQRSDGAWTYLTAGTADQYPSGDMSMTQYGVMAMWTIKQLGLEVSPDTVNRMAYWLMMAQDPNSGSFSYQTTITNGNVTKREGERESMAAAGMASIYVCRDLFGYNSDNTLKSEEDRKYEAFEEKLDEEELAKKRAQRRSGPIPKQRFDNAQSLGNGWFRKKFAASVDMKTQYFFYYLYAFERYAAFKELAEHVHAESPPWYNNIARFLLEQQKPDGSWVGNLGAGIDTSYAVLFLLRSTMKTFAKIADPPSYGGGNMRGGRGLPKTTDNIRVKDGKIVSLTEIGDSGKLLERLGDLENTDDATLLSLAELPAKEVELLLNKNKNKMKKLVGHEKAEQRMAAVQLFAKSGTVENALPLIYALTDPDPDVAQAALDGLCRLTRQPEAGALPQELGERLLIIEKWKKWYRTIDPNASFEER